MTSRLTALERVSHLIRRIEYGAEAGYYGFKNNESNKCQPIKKMSKLTEAILCNIEYQEVIKRRRDNFIFLCKALKKHNRLNVEIDDQSVPMGYPFLLDKGELKESLRKKRIFTATYWPNIVNIQDKKSIEFSLYSNLLCLPVDQRYDRVAMEYILTTIDKLL